MSNFLLEVSTVIDPTGGAAAAAGAAANTAANGAAAPAAVMSPMTMIILYCVVIFGALYFFSIKPQKKREKAMDEMRSKIKPGDSVLLTTGMFGKIVDVTAECYIVEFGTNKGIRIPVLKSEVMSVREPNLSNKEPEPLPEPEKKSLFGRKKEEKPKEV